MPYDVNNPHPGFGKDPNIINEFGHTRYPRWVDGPDKDKSGHPIRVVVKDAEEEEKVTGKKLKGSKPSKGGWNDDKKEDDNK